MGLWFDDAELLRDPRRAGCPLVMPPRGLGVDTVAVGARQVRRPC